MKSRIDIRGIISGLFNYFFKNESVEDISYYRNEICIGCDSFDEEGTKCFVKGTGPCCGECGCSLKLKTRDLGSSCPLNKWGVENE